MNENFSLPVQFELEDNPIDDRFLKVKIFIAHTGENLNNSKFSKETLDEMSKTLAGIPIVGYIKEEADGRKDFDNHRQKIVVKDGKVDVVYSGHAYGFIPEANNAQFEIRSGREWLTVEGYVWTKFRDSISIILDGNGVKSQSMEIEVFESFVDDEGLVNYVNARFSGLCILGDEVPPGMTGSTIELFSHKNEILNEFRSMMKEFSKKKEDGNVPLPGEKDLKDDVAENTVVDKSAEFADKKKKSDEKDEKSKSTTDKEAEKDEKKKDESKKADGKDATDVNDEDEKAEVDDKKTKDKEKSKSKGKKANFELSHDDIRTELRGLIMDTVDKDNSYVYVCQVFDDHVISQIETYENNSFATKHIMHTYTKENDVITLGEAKEVVPAFLTKEEMAKIDADRKDIKDLREKLSLYEVEAKEEKVAEFAEILGEKADDIRSRFDELTVEQVEKEVGFTCFQINQQNKEEDPTTVNAINFSSANSTDKAAQRYGGVAAYFN